MVRLFIGGLPPSVQHHELEARFAPFGQVTALEFTAAKGHGSAAAPGAGGLASRGFAYVDLQPKDEASVHKLMSVYNHSRWKGHVLRVELARPGYLQRLQREWAEEASNNDAGAGISRSAAAAAAASAAEAEEQPLDPNRPFYIPMPGRKRKFVKTTLQCTLPDGKKRVKKTFFPPAQPLPLNQLPWTSPATAPRGLYKLNEVLHLPSTPYVPPAAVPAVGAAAAEPGQRVSSISPVGNGVEVAFKYAAPAPSKAPLILPREQHAYLKILKAVDSHSQKQALQQRAPKSQQAQQAQQQQQQQQQPGAREATAQGATKGVAKGAKARGRPVDLHQGTVEFLDDGTDEQQGVADLDRFDSSSEDGDGGAYGEDNEQQRYQGGLERVNGEEGEEEEDGMDLGAGAEGWDADELPSWHGDKAAVNGRVGAVLGRGEEEEEAEGEEGAGAEQEEQVEEDNEVHEATEGEEFEGGDEEEEEGAEEGVADEGEDEVEGVDDGGAEGEEEEVEAGAQDEGRVEAEAGEEEEDKEVSKQEAGLELAVAEAGRQGNREGRELGRNGQRLGVLHEAGQPSTSAAGHRGEAAAAPQQRPKTPLKVTGRARGMDLSRFGSDSEEEYRDVDDSGDEAAGDGGSGQRALVPGRQAAGASGSGAQRGGRSGELFVAAAPAAKHGQEGKVAGQQPGKAAAGVLGGAQDEGKARFGAHEQQQQERRRGKQPEHQQQQQPEPQPTEKRARDGKGQQQQQQEQQQQQQQPPRQKQRQKQLQQQQQAEAAGVNAQPTASPSTAAAAPRRRAPKAPMAPVAFHFSFPGSAATAFLPMAPPAANVGTLESAAATEARSPGASGRDAAHRVRQQALRRPSPGGQAGTLQGQASSPAVAGAESGEGAGKQSALRAAPTAAGLLRFGLSFVRPRDKSDQELRDAWEQQREGLTADFKSKQRTAARHQHAAGGRGGKRRAGR